MEEVYEAIGESTEVVIGGRNLELGDNEDGWDILDRWRDTAGDESDEEDYFELDGNEDEDLL